MHPRTNGQTERGYDKRNRVFDPRRFPAVLTSEGEFLSYTAPTIRDPFVSC